MDMLGYIILCVYACNTNQQLLPFTEMPQLSAESIISVLLHIIPSMIILIPSSPISLPLILRHCIALFFVNKTLISSSSVAKQKDIKS